jgi:uncharacterized protein (DUF2236 family)
MDKGVAMNQCEYLNQGAFTVVITPHCMDRARERGFDKTRLPWYTLFNVAEQDNPNQYVEVARAWQVYINKKYNELRARWELEVISCTPNDWHRPNDKCILRIA